MSIPILILAFLLVLSSVFGMTTEVIDMDGSRVDKLRVTRT